MKSVQISNKESPRVFLIEYLALNCKSDLGIPIIDNAWIVKTIGNGHVPLKKVSRLMAKEIEKIQTCCEIATRIISFNN